MKYTILFIMLIALVGFTSALPTTQAVTIVNPGYVTFNATGGTGDGWFMWGSSNGYNYFWQTPNQTIPVSGMYSDYQMGMPMLSGRTYYVVAVDSTGVGNQVTFVVPNATPLSQTSFGSGAVAITRSGFNLTQSLPAIVVPFTNMIGFWTYALLFFFIFTGWWMRQGDITIPMLISLVFGFMIWGAGAIGSGMGIPPEVMSIGMGLIVASIAGLFFSLFSK